jgi:hypothetical protein
MRNLVILLKEKAHWGLQGICFGSQGAQLLLNSFQIVPHHTSDCETKGQALTLRQKGKLFSEFGN